MASSHVLPGAKRERGKGKTTNFAAPIFNSWSARDPSETTAAVVWFQGRIKTERKSCHAGGRGRGRRTPWCHVAQFWALLPRSAGLWFRSKLAGRLGVCTLRLPDVVFNPPGASSPAEGRTSPVSWGCAGGDGKPGLSLHTSCSPRYWQCRSPRLSWVNGSSFHCQVDYMS